MMSNSRYKSRSKRPRPSHHDSYEEDYHRDSDSSDADDSSFKQEKTRPYSRSPSPRHKINSSSLEKHKRNTESPLIKSLVKVPLPSLLSPQPLVPGSNRSLVKAKVVRNKSEHKGQVAKSLMDLQFEDRSLQSTGFYQRNTSKRIEEKPGLLPDPLFGISHWDPSFISGGKRNDFTLDTYGDDQDPWISRREMKQFRRSWTESEVASVSSHSLFNSNYKPLVVESEPINKVKKFQNSPKPLLESHTLSSLTLSMVPKSLLSDPSLSKTKSQKEISSHTSVGKTKKTEQESVRHRECIVNISSDKKNVSFLIIPSTLSWLHLHGRARIKVLRGVVTIMAHTLTLGTSYDVFSPSSNCLLSLQIDPQDFMSPQVVKTQLEEFIKNPTGLEHLSNKSIGILRVEKLDSAVCDYVTSLPPFTKLFIPKPLTVEYHKSKNVGVSLFNGGLMVAPEAEMGIPCMAWNDNFNDALDKWLETIDKAGKVIESPVFVSCGSKNSGKSMFNRCAINTTLRSVQEVAYIDCDVGQTEFSPPATLSLHIIDKPILSPPFCHQRHAEKLVFYGDVTPSQNPTVYIKCLEYVYKEYQRLASGKKLPLIVNTMGFPEGVGFLLFIDTLNIVQPDLVIQFESDQLYANFPPVTQEMVALDEGWTYNKCPPPNVKERMSQVKEHVLMILPSLNRNDKNPSSNKLHPADFRNLAMFSALSIGLGENETLMSLTPYTVSYRCLAIHICRHNLQGNEILMAIDATVVALCESDLSQAKQHRDDLPFTFDEIPVCDCLGLGIVRAIDKEKGLLYLSTTLPRHVLKRTNTILKGTPSFPDHFILKQQSITSHPVPYVDSLAQATAAFGLRARSRMPRLHTKAKKIAE